MASYIYVADHPYFDITDADGQYRETYPSHSPEQLIAHALAYHRAAWPAVQAVISAHANWERPCVLEGWGVLPAYVAGLELEAIGALFLVPDEALFERRCRENPSFYQGADDEEALIRSFAHRSALFSRMLEASATEHGLPVLRGTATTSLEEVLEQSLSLL